MLHASKYYSFGKQTFKIEPYTQYAIYYEVSPHGNIKAAVTSLAKQEKDRMALVALGSGNGEKEINAQTKKVTLKANMDSDIICLYLTNGSENTVKYKVKLSGSKNAAVTYKYYENNGEGAG